MSIESTSLRIARTSLPQQARDQLRDMIVRGVLQPGGNLGEAELSDTLGISRTPLREALKLLETEGLVELQSNRGAFVVPIRATDIEDVFDVAAILEARAAELAATRGSAAQFTALRQLQVRMEAEHSAQRREAYFELNQAIHRAIVATSGNAALRCAHEMLFARVQRIRFLALGSQVRWDQSIDEHRDVLAALEARDPGRAGAALARHVRHTGQRAASLLQAELMQAETNDPSQSRSKGTT